MHDDQRAGDGDHRRDDEKPQIVQLTANDLSKEEVDIELAKVKEGNKLLLYPSSFFKEG